jgi:enterochelin esterase family protein
MPSAHEGAAVPPAPLTPPKTPRPTPAPLYGPTPPVIGSLKRSLREIRSGLKAGETDAQECRRLIDAAVRDFWQTAGRQTPVMAPDPKGAGHALVTFLWRDDRARAVLLFANRITDETDLGKSLMRRVPGTDVWHLTYRMETDWRASYCILPCYGKGGVSDLLGADQASVRHALDCGIADPRNPLRCQNRVGNILSVVELADAPPQPWLRPRHQVARHGTVSTHELPEGYRVWVYEPPAAPVRARGKWALPGGGKGVPGLSAAAQPAVSRSAAGSRPPASSSSAALPALVMFDGDMWMRTEHFHETLDNLIGEGRVPPMYVLLVETGDVASRWEKLGEDSGIEDFVADGLLAWARGRYPITDDPARLVVAGQSLGALTALLVAAKRPESIQNVIAQSASLWRGRLLEQMKGPEGLLHSFTARVYLEVGRQEHVLLPYSRDLAGMLRQQGLDCSYVEYNGGHDYVCWRGGIADGLCWVADGWLADAGDAARQDGAAGDGAEEQGAAGPALRPLPPVPRPQKPSLRQAPAPARPTVRQLRRERLYGKTQHDDRGAGIIPPKVARPKPAPRTRTAVIAPLKAAIRAIHATCREQGADAQERQRLIDAAVEDFWETTGRQTPVILPDPKSEGHAFVTFLWRDSRASAVLLFANRITDETDLGKSLLKRIRHTDIWHLTYRMETDWRASYCFVPCYDKKSVSDMTGVHQASIRRTLDRGIADPRNPLQCQNRARNTLSVVELADAPPQPWLGIRPQVARRGKVSSHQLPDGHMVWVYEPALPEEPRGRDALPEGPRGKDAALPALVMFDGDVWMRTERFHETLDNLIGEGRIPPMYALLVETDDIAARWDELSTDSRIEDFVADGLLAWARGRYPITDDPARLVIAGQSLGALTAFWVAIRRPACFQNVVLQSASLWRGRFLTRMTGQKGLLRGFTARVYLEVGKQEWVLLPLARDLAKMLRRRKLDCAYIEYNGGHDYACWRGGIADALCWITDRWAADNSANAGSS